MEFWDQVSLLSLLMLTEYTFIKTCVLFLCFCEGAFLHVTSRDTRLSALLVSRKRKIWVTTLPYWWEPTWDVCWWTSVYTSRWPLAPSAGTDRGHAQVLLLLEDSAMCMGTGTLKSSRTAQAGTLRLPLSLPWEMKKLKVLTGCMLQTAPPQPERTRLCRSLGYAEQ